MEQLAILDIFRNKLKSNFLFVVITVIVSFIVMFLALSAGLDVVKIQSLYSGLDSSAIYIVSPSNNDIKKLGNDQYAKYEYEFMDFNEETFKVLYINREALEYGIPYYEHSFITINQTLENGFYATDNYHSLIDNNFCKKLDLESVPDFNNKIMNRNYLSDYIICVDDSYSFNKLDYIVVDGKPELLSSFDIDNDINGMLFNIDCSTGALIKDYYKSLYSWSINLIYMICFIPILFLILIFSNFILLFIRKNYKYYKINQIFFMSKKKMYIKVYTKFILCLFIAVSISSIINFIVFKEQLFIVFIIFLIVFIGEGLCLTISSNIAINKFYKEAIEMEEIR